MYRIVLIAALTLLPNMVNCIHLAFGCRVPPLGSCYPNIQLLLLHLHFLVQCQMFTPYGLAYREERLQRSSRMQGTLHKFGSYSGERCAFWTTVGRAGIKLQILLNIPMSLTLWLPYTALYHDRSAISSSHIMGHLLGYVLVE